MTLRLGIDLGGTKIAAVVLAPNGAVLWEDRRPTPREDYRATVNAIADVVARGERHAGAACTVGLGIPGAISPATGLVKNANSTWLNGKPFKDDLERVLARPVSIENDANCLAMSEAVDGAAAGADVVFGVILGTGTGGGLVVRGKLVTGANAIGGEWGHNPLPWPDAEEFPGPACYCGQSGCVETFLSGPGLAHDYHRRGGGPVDAVEVAARADTGEPLAKTTLRAWIRRLSKALATVINVLDPNVIVVGGGLSGMPLIYAEVPKQWGAWIFSDSVSTRIVPAKFGDASGVRGAAWLHDQVPGARRGPGA